MAVFFFFFFVNVILLSHSLFQPVGLEQPNLSSFERSKFLLGRLLVNHCYSPRDGAGSKGFLTASAHPLTLQTENLRWREGDVIAWSQAASETGLQWA